MKVVLLLWWRQSLSISLITLLVPMPMAKEVDNDLAFDSLLTIPSPSFPPSSSSFLSSSVPLVPWLKRRMRILPILNSKMEGTPAKSATANRKDSGNQQMQLVLNRMRCVRRIVTENTTADTVGRALRNNYVQLVPNELVRKRRPTDAPLSRRQKRTGFPPPALGASPAAFSPVAPPASATSPEFFASAFPAQGPAPVGQSYEAPPVEQEFFNEPAQQIEQQQYAAAEQLEQQQYAAAEQFIQQQGAQAPPAFPPALPSQPLAVPFIPPSPPAAINQPASLMEASSLPAPFYQSPVEPTEAAEVAPGGPSFFQPPMAVQPLSPYEEELITSTSFTEPSTTSTSAAQRCELLRYPLPECYTDDSNLMCCNPELESTMKTAFDQLVNAEDNFHRCNVQQIANKVQLMSEDRFNTSFEVITGIGDYASRSHFFHNFICKIERDKRFILAYATARPEFDSVPIDGDTSGKTHGTVNALSTLRNSESVQHGKTKMTEGKSNLLNFVYTFRRTQRAQNLSDQINHPQKLIN